MFEGLFQPVHLIILFVVAVLVLGPRKLPELGKGLGEGIRSFKSAIKDASDSNAARRTFASLSELALHWTDALSQVF
ncbi:MAG: twin-arginine translocase TatA/TatE family subunit [Candidatus Acidiferrales bacterium]